VIGLLLLWVCLRVTDIGPVIHCAVLWEVHGEECKNYNVLQGHTNAVLDLKWAPDGKKVRGMRGVCVDPSLVHTHKGGEGPMDTYQGHADSITGACASALTYTHTLTLPVLQIVSASADKTVAVWDANVGKRIRKCALHTGCVNSVAMPGAKGGQLYASGSDDGFVRVWDVRSKQAVHTLPHTYQVTKQPHACRRITIASRRDGGGWMAYASAHAHAHAYAQILAVELSADASKVFAGGIDNCVQVWDLAKGGEEPVDTYQGHADSITGLRLSPDGCVRACVRMCAPAR